ncbi:hypothetical protein BD779DRAFT_1670977 [Infundibulicybe gibba]|nr:hypothetical protein BD779DRAFT_1670977 [Infundibulicybe gibba]
MFRRLRPGALVFVYTLLLFQVTLGAITNRTIDDTLGDSVSHVRPVYSPSQGGIWEDATCKGCRIAPDASKAFQGTWTAATYNPGLKAISIDLAFKGTAIYVFFILGNDAGAGITTRTECDFILDGDRVSSFRHTPSQSKALEYNALAFSTANLPNIDHKLSIVTANKSYSVFVNFDYAIYTAEDEVTSSSSSSLSSSSSSPLSTPGPASASDQPQPSGLSTANASRNGTPIGPIIGGICGGLAFVGALVILLLVCYRRRRHQKLLDDCLLDITQSHVSDYSHNAGRTEGSSLSSTQPYRGQVGDHYGSSIDTTSRYDPNHVTLQYNIPKIPGRSLSNPHSPQNLQHFTPSPPNGGGFVYSSAVGLNGTSAFPPALRSTEEVRHARQLKLDQQIQAARQEMWDLKSEVGRRGSMSKRGLPKNNEEMTAMKEQMEAMKQQIEYLQSQQQSPWARGLSDDPPPGYTLESNGQNYSIKQAPRVLALATPNHSFVTSS